MTFADTRAKEECRRRREPPRVPRVVRRPEMEPELTLYQEASDAKEAVELEAEALVEASEEVSQASSESQSDKEESAVGKDTVGEVSDGGWRPRDVPLEPHGKPTHCGGSPIDRPMTTPVRSTGCREELAAA